VFLACSAKVLADVPTSVVIALPECSSLAHAFV
jgi:hypothetical protein